MQVYYTVGVYPDGARHSAHVHTDNIAEYVRRQTDPTTFIPFARMDYMPCPGPILSCDCDRYELGVEVPKL